MSVLEIIEEFDEVKSDPLMPRNIQTKLKEIINILKQDFEVSLKVNKSLQLLDDISEDPSLQPFLKTQIWHLSSLLESL